MKTAKILVVDDEKDIRNLMQEILSEENYDVITAANGQQAKTAWRDQAPDLIFLDIWMPDIDGITLLKGLIDESLLEHSRVVMMSGHGTIETAIEATRLGAYDFLEKPLSLAKLLITAERALSDLRLHTENRHLKQKLPEQILPIGKSKRVVELRDTIERLAKYSMPLLIQGEPGTGKHRVAEAIHKLGDRHKKALYEIHGADFDDLENVILGQHQTGTTQLGELVRADGGTLVVSNVDALSENGQNFLAQLVFDQSFVRPGDNKKISINLRLIALTQGGLDDLAAQGLFRDDLLQRLKVMPVEVPALRQHTEDIPDLIDYFLDYFLTHEGLNYREFDVAAQNVLRQYAWPGNYRELQNLIQRLLILGEGKITDDEVKQALEQSKTDQMSACNVDTSVNLKTAKERFEAAYLSQLLRETGGNVTETAKRSGVERTNLYRKLKALNIDPKDPK
ncbi:sigma-54 dependent transcriptional regulator [Thiomicrospira sp. WB1]|uniref:sigma-54-dependent transcriptional regulator n=1 Tax=Thiomicrospira sp. WB1 TaxID=1685380 RepID=UPI0007484C46|nr:sigma-54 dependent transcriptional regulator [Thiomicrospira sp. WB1]KUJ71203.1 Fis family transcriptional regulator [Thiomicrospira sp. WB1]